MISQFGFSDDLKMAIWPARIPILDGWHEHLPLAYILLVTFLELQSTTTKRDATIWVGVQLFSMRAGSAASNRSVRPKGLSKCGRGSLSHINYSDRII
jgi:hypothetical protein